jgi:HlyD family secretion protein
MQAINTQIRAIYTALNIDARTAGACRRQQGGNAGQMRGSSQRGSRQMGGADQGGALTPSPEMGGPQRAKAGLVFVTDSTKTVFHPRIVQLGEGNLDFTEVISGLKEGERVVMLSALALQSQRQQMQDRFRQNASPLGGATGGRGGRGR